MRKTSGYEPPRGWILVVNIPQKGAAWSVLKRGGVSAFYLVYPSVLTHYQGLFLVLRNNLAHYCDHPDLQVKLLLNWYSHSDLVSCPQDAMGAGPHSPSVKVTANCVEVWDTLHSYQDISANTEIALVRVCHGNLYYCIWVSIKTWHSHASSLALYTLLSNQFQVQAQVSYPQMSAPHHLERFFFLGLGYFPLISSTWRSLKLLAKIQSKSCTG